MMKKIVVSKNKMNIVSCGILVTKKISKLLSENNFSMIFSQKRYITHSWWDIIDEVIDDTNHSNEEISEELREEVLTRLRYSSEWWGFRDSFICKILEHARVTNHWKSHCHYFLGIREFLADNIKFEHSDILDSDNIKEDIKKIPYEKLQEINNLSFRWTNWKNPIFIKHDNPWELRYHLTHLRRQQEEHVLYALTSYQLKIDQVLKSLNDFYVYQRLPRKNFLFNWYLHNRLNKKITYSSTLAMMPEFMINLDIPFPSRSGDFIYYLGLRYFYERKEDALMDTDFANFNIWLREKDVIFLYEEYLRSGRSWNPFEIFYECFKRGGAIIYHQGTQSGDMDPYYFWDLERDARDGVEAAKLWLPVGIKEPPPRKIPTRPLTYSVELEVKLFEKLIKAALYKDGWLKKHIKAAMRKVYNTGTVEEKKTIVAHISFIRKIWIRISLVWQWIRYGLYVLERIWYKKIFLNMFKVVWYAILGIVWGVSRMIYNICTFPRDWWIFNIRAEEIREHWKNGGKSHYKQRKKKLWFRTIMRRKIWFITSRYKFIRKYKSFIYRFRRRVAYYGLKKGDIGRGKDKHYIWMQHQLDRGLYLKKTAAEFRKEQDEIFGIRPEDDKKYLESMRLNEWQDEGYTKRTTKK